MVKLLSVKLGLDLLDLVKDIGIVGSRLFPILHVLQVVKSLLLIRGTLGHGLSSLTLL